MSYGNSNPKAADKGSRFSWELGMIKNLNELRTLATANNVALADILTAMGDLALEVTAESINLNTDNLENLLQGIDGSVETPGMIRTTTNDTLAAGYFSVSFTNTGVAEGTLLGAALKANETVEFTAKTGNTLGAIVYDASGTEFLILTTII
jgi:hypothetical protein